MNSPKSGQSVLTVADLLALDEFRSGEVTVAAGGHRLGNRVEWVHVFETPAVSEVLRGGEFLLTTGIGLAGMSPAEVEALVAAVARSGAAGIGFEPTHAAADVLVPACRAHDLPLIVFGHDVRFVDITHVVHERLVSGELQTLRRAVTLQAQLRDAAREGLGPSGLVAALGDVLGAQVLLERIDRTPVATSPEDGLDVAFLDALDRHRQRLPTSLHSRPVNPGAGCTCSRGTATSSTSWPSTRPPSCSPSRSPPSRRPTRCPPPSARGSSSAWPRAVRAAPPTSSAGRGRSASTCRGRRSGPCTGAGRSSGSSGWAWTRSWTDAGRWSRSAATRTSPRWPATSSAAGR